jgi:RNA recognition motif-containing protein
LSPLDQLPKIKIYRDESGEPKGDASICYNAAESVDMAVNFFDGGYIRPNTKPITVSRAEFQKKNPIPPSTSAGDESQQQRRKKGKITHAQVKVTQNAMAQALAWNEDDDLGLNLLSFSSLTSPRCVEEKSIENRCRGGNVSPFGE